MSTTRIKDKLSQLVSSQLPEFVQSNYGTFVSFLEAYYKFLEQDQNAFELIQNSKSYNDLDSTTESFVQYFVDTYAPTVPIDAFTNKRLLVKRIKDLYEAKGSKISFEHIFRLFFDTTVSITYPYENVLRASAGKWQQRFSIRVRTVSGDRGVLLNRLLSHVFNGVLFNTPIISVRNLTSDLTELFLDSNFISTYTAGDRVFVTEGSNVLFDATVETTLNDYTITNPGSGFKVGQVFSINFGGGIGTLIKIAGVTASGGLERIKFIDFGYNYPTDSSVVSVQFSPTSAVSITTNIFTSRTQGFSGSGQLLSFSDSSPDRYFDEDYMSYSPLLYTYSSILGSFGDDSYMPFEIEDVSSDPTLASISFRQGALASYPGSYYTNDSFLSEAEVRLEDSLLYQPFAYQTITDIDIEIFFDLVKQIIHPAGQRLFNNRVISNEIDLSNVTYLSPVSNRIGFEALSVFEAYDQFEKVLYKVFEGEIEAVVAQDDDFINVGKYFVDVVESLIDDDTLRIEKVINDTVVVSEDVSLLFPLKPELNDPTIPTELFSSRINKPINNSDSTVFFSEIKYWTQFNKDTHYFSESYAYDDYVEGTTVINLT